MDSRATSGVNVNRACKAEAELARIRAYCKGVDPVEYIKHLEHELDDLLTERQQYAFDRPPVHAQ